MNRCLVKSIAKITRFTYFVKENIYRGVFLINQCFSIGNIWLTMSGVSVLDQLDFVRVITTQYAIYTVSDSSRMWL